MESAVKATLLMDRGVKGQDQSRKQSQSVVTRNPMAPLLTYEVEEKGKIDLLVSFELRFEIQI